jgi:hypothetical protein
MVKLEETITTPHFTYVQVKRTETVAMYSVNDTRHTGRGSEPYLQVIGYEVFLVRDQKEVTININGNTSHQPHKEKWPSNESFGKTAWSFALLPQAQAKYDELLGQVEKKGDTTVFKKEEKVNTTNANKIVMGEYTIQRFSNGTTMATKNKKPCSPKSIMQMACVNLKGMNKADVDVLKIKEMAKILFPN